MLGDHLAFTANLQPNMILPLMLGKLGGGILALAMRIAVPTARRLEQQDRDDGVIGEDEYRDVEAAPTS